jgi:UDP-glucuronate decarboxylase
LEFAKMGARILHASTSEVYGDPEVHPQQETYRGSVNTWGPRACYDEGKRVAETLCYEHLMSGRDVRVVRIFNTYGPRMQMDDGRVVSNFVVQALKGEDITVYGDGSQTRSFCYVDDLVRGILSYLHKDQPNCSPINLGNPVELTIKEAADVVLNVTNSQCKIVFKDLPQDDPRKRKPDIDLARKVLDWSPTVSFQDGVKRTAEYFRDLLK